MLQTPHYKSPKSSATMAGDDTMDATLQIVWEFCNDGMQKKKKKNLLLT